MDQLENKFIRIPAKLENRLYNYNPINRQENLAFYFQVFNDQ
jgi:hypothetical protein